MKKLVISNNSIPTIVIDMISYFDILEYEGYSDRLAAAISPQLKSLIDMLSANDYADYISYINYAEEIMLDYLYGEKYNRRESDNESLYLHFQMKRTDGTLIDRCYYEIRISHHFTNSTDEEKKYAKLRRRKLSKGKKCEFREVVVKVRGIPVGNGSPYSSYAEALEALDNYLSKEQAKV